MRLLVPQEENRPAPKTVVADPYEEIRVSDKRFKDITLLVSNGVIRINGEVKKMQDAWDLAARLNQVPGVRQVIVSRVREQ